MTINLRVKSKIFDFLPFHESGKGDSVAFQVAELPLQNRTAEKWEAEAYG